MKSSYILILVLICLAPFGLLYSQVRFDIEAFSDTTKYGWEDYYARADFRSELSDRQQLLHIYELESQPLTANILKSSLIPGWGQFSTKQNIKAEVILGVEILALGTSLFFYDRSMNYYRKYQNATQFNEMQDLYKQAQTPYQYSMIALALGAVVWIYNIYDVVSSTETYNAMIWDEIMQRHSGSNLQITPEGVQLRF